jgi:hypothetical protein
MGSLTITYFHTGIRTIIGVESFHGPVRDGKGWYQLAMVIRHEGVLWWVLRPSQPIWGRSSRAHVLSTPRCYWIVFVTRHNMISTLACVSISLIKTPRVARDGASISAEARTAADTHWL